MSECAVEMSCSVMSCSVKADECSVKGVADERSVLGVTDDVSCSGCEVGVVEDRPDDGVVAYELVVPGIS